MPFDPYSLTHLVGQDLVVIVILKYIEWSHETNSQGSVARNKLFPRK